MCGARETSPSESKKMNRLFHSCYLDVADLQLKIVLKCQKGQVANKVHYPRDVRLLVIHNYFFNRLVVTEKQDALIGES